MSAEGTKAAATSAVIARLGHTTGGVARMVGRTGVYADHAGG